MSTLCKSASDFFNQTIWVARCSGRNIAGDIEYCEPVAKSAMVEVHEMTSSSGTEERLRTSYRVFTDCEIGLQDMVWMPWTDCSNECDGRKPRAIEVCFDPYCGEVSHWEVII